MFKILMDGSLIKRITELENENGKLKEEVRVAEADKRNYSDGMIKELREKMQKSLVESDIEREKLKTKLEVYEKIFAKFKININQEL